MCKSVGGKEASESSVSATVFSLKGLLSCEIVKKCLSIIFLNEEKDHQPYTLCNMPDLAKTRIFVLTFMTLTELHQQ